MRATALVLILFAGCYTDGNGNTCPWVPGGDGTCPSDDGGGGGSTSSAEYVRYPAATVVSTGDAMFVYASEIDDRAGASLVYGKSRPGGLPATLDPWVVDVSGVYTMHGFSGRGRALLEITDVNGTRAVTLDADGMPTSVSLVDGVFSDAVFDGKVWNLFAYSGDLHGITVSTIGGAAPTLVASVEDLETTFVLPSFTVLALDGSTYLGWFSSDRQGTRTPHVTRIQNGRVVATATVGAEGSAADPMTFIPGRALELWTMGPFGGQRIGVDPRTLASGILGETATSPARSLVELADGSYVGYDLYTLQHFADFETTPRALDNVPIDLTSVGLAAAGNDFIFVTRQSGQIRATFEADADVVLAADEEVGIGCSAGGAPSSCGILLCIFAFRRRHRSR